MRYSAKRGIEIARTSTGRPTAVGLPHDRVGAQQEEFMPHLLRSRVYIRCNNLCGICGGH